MKETLGKINELILQRRVIMAASFVLNFPTSLWHIKWQSNSYYRSNMSMKERIFELRVLNKSTSKDLGT